MIDNPIDKAATCAAQTGAISIISCIAAERRREIPNDLARRVQVRVLQGLADPQAIELMEHLSRALDILEGKRP